MGLLASIALIALGAILLWQVDGSVGGVDIAVIGVIAMVVGAVGAALSLLVPSRVHHLGGSDEGDEERMTTFPR
jgi:hypothetical protein